MEIKYRGYTINIEQDECPGSPRDDDNLGTMICFHSRYRLGDKSSYSLQDMVDYITKEYSLFDAGGYYETDTDKVMNWLHKNCIVLPLYLYDHSGLSMSTGSFIGRAHHAEWDSGRVGLIYVTKERVRSECGWKRITAKRREQVVQYLRGEVEEYDDYLTGNVYGYTIEELDDSCWGFYGYPDEDSYIVQEAKGVVDWAIEEQRKEHFEQVKTWIRNHVPLLYREPLAVK